MLLKTRLNFSRKEAFADAKVMVIEMNYNDYQPSQKITSFCRATYEELQIIKNFYGFHMDDCAMKDVQNHFYRVEAREPSVDELALIDSFYLAHSKSTAAVRINSVRSVDKNVGEAFDDLIKKLEYIEGHKNQSYSYSFLLSASQKVLEYANKTATSAMPLTFSGKSPLMCALSNNKAENHFSVSCGDFGFVISDKIASIPYEEIYKICDSDNFVLFCKDEYAEANGPLEERIADLMKFLGKAVICKSIAMTYETGIVGAVLNASEGAYLNLSSLYTLPYSFSPRNLRATLPNECAVAVFSERSLSTLLANAARYGIKAVPFGRPTKVKRLNLIYGSGQPISVASDFLRNIGASSFVCADISQIAGNEYYVSSEKLSAFVNHIAYESDYVVKKSGKLVSACTLERGGFIGAAEALIHAVAKLVSCGISYKNIISTVSINAKNRNAAEMLSYITGIYRTRAELTLLSQNDSINDTDGNALCALVTAKDNQIETPHTFTDESSSVYLLYPRMSDDGLPKFSDLRMLFDYVNSLIISKKALSVRAVGVGGLAQTITDMNSDTSIEDIKGTELAVCGSFVVESKEKIDGLVLFSKNQ